MPDVHPTRSLRWARPLILAVVAAGAIAALAGCTGKTTGGTPATAFLTAAKVPTTATICTTYAGSFSTKASGISLAGPSWLTLNAAGNDYTLDGTPEWNDWGDQSFSIAGKLAGKADSYPFTIAIASPTITPTPATIDWVTADQISPTETLTITPACNYELTVTVVPKADVFTVVESMPITASAGVATFRLSTEGDGPTTSEVTVRIHPRTPGATDAVITIPVDFHH